MGTVRDPHWVIQGRRHPQARRRSGPQRLPGAEPPVASARRPGYFERITMKTALTSPVPGFHALLAVLLVLAGRPGDAAGQPADRARVDAAFAFLARQHDQFHDNFIVYDDRDSGAIHFFPSGWMGDLIGLPPRKAKTIVDDACPVMAFRGSTCIKLTYP